MKVSALALIAVAPMAPAAAQTQLRLLHINDHHSHLTENSGGYVDILGDDIPSAVSANNGNTTGN